MKVYGASSTIQLVSPLTKEQVSFDNGGGGNWGAERGADIHQIKTMTEAEIEAGAEDHLSAILQKIATQQDADHVWMAEIVQTVKDHAERIDRPGSPGWIN